MATSDERALEIRKLTEQLGDVDFALSKASPRLRYSHDYEQAALLSSFDPEELGLRGESLSQLLTDCLVVVRDEAVRYILDPDVRRRVLRQLGNRSRMRQTLEELPEVPHDPVQQMIGRIVAGEPAVGREASPENLHAAYQALGWFSGVVATESPDELRARIEGAGLLDRFSKLVGDNFAGRMDELQKLREYVGALEGVLARVLRRWSSFEERPALVISGPGGIGKSTLLAKFILDNAGSGQMPFAYINFDSPTVAAGDPKTILVETLRQLALEYPDYRITITQLKDRWQSEVTALADLTETDRRARAARLTDRFLDELVSTLGLLQLGDVPLLLVLDTFEAVQERQRGDVVLLFGFLRSLQRAYPALRVVISGRAAAPEDVAPQASDSADLTIPTEVMRLKGLDHATSTTYLQHAGLSPEHAAEVALYLIPEEAVEEGASPLSLRVAAELWRRDRERPQLDATFWAQLRAGRIQAQLITRYLRHVDQQSLAGRLALPSMLLRRIEPSALVEVVARAWDVDVLPSQSDEVFDELAQLVSLVTEGSGRGLVPRPEVQRLVVDLLTDSETTKVSRLNDLAVEHSIRTGEQAGEGLHAAEARFEEIVYRLARGDDEDVVRSRWLPECAEFVTGRMPLLPLGAQGLLEQLAGFELTPQMRASASRQVWEGEALGRARRALEAGKPEDVVAIAAERPDAPVSSPLFLLVARAQLALGRPWEALDAATAALSQTSPEVSSADVCDLHLVAAEAALALDRPQEVLDSADDALMIAGEREDVPRRVSALLLQIKVQRDRSVDAAIDSARQIQALLSDDRVLPEIDLFKLMSVLEAFPELLPVAIRSGGLRYLTAEVTRQVARSITDVDVEVSEARGERPGFVALGAGLSVGSSVTRTWKDALETLDVPTQNAVITMLGQQVATAETLRRLLAKELAAAAALRDADQHHVLAGPPETVAAQTPSISLNRRQRRQLIDALLSELSVDALQDIAAVEFDVSFGSLASLDVSPEASVDRFLSAAESGGWLAELVIAARNRQPGAPKLFGVANELGVSALHYAPSRLSRTVPADLLAVVLGRLGTIEGQVGRLESADDGLVGTGLLVSPELLITSGSIVVTGPTRGASHVRLGLKADAKGRRLDPGTTYSIGPDGVVDVIPFDGLDLGLVRLEGYPADEPLGSSRGQRSHARRGFADVSVGATMATGQNAFVCWQQQARLELHIERRTQSSDGPFFTVPSLGPTSVGAPCFNRSMEFVGLVLADKPTRARAVTAEGLWTSLVERGHGGAVNMPLV